MSWEWKQPEAALSEEKLLQTRFPLPEPATHLYYYLQQQILKLGKRLQIRQVALATAQVYLLRFYSAVDIRKTNPYLFLTTAFYLACKTEECPQHIRVVAQEARNFWPDHMQGADVTIIGECEFVLIQELKAQLAVQHPYGHLLDAKEELGLTQDETNLAWHAINDFHATISVLVHTPLTIAAAAISVVVTVRPSSGGSGIPITAVGGLRNELPSHGSGDRPTTPMTKQQKLVKWLVHSSLNLEAVVECSQELISLYTALEKYSESTCKQQMATIARARGIAGV